MGEDFPQEFGQYTLHELIGRGGMAEIYRATMPGIGGFEKTVAIKKILPHLAEDDEFTSMLIDEARIIESLDHSNIAQVFDLGKREGTYYIAMEYIHGVDLAEMIDELKDRGEVMPIPHVIHITSSVCAGLDFAHSKTDEEGNPLNVIHRDISPHNIRLSFAGEVKIIDFGVAKAADREAHTKMGVIKGKLLYMAPEQAKAEDLDGRADLFAAGLCAYKMLTGELPFEGENEFQVYNNILQKEIVPPKKLRPEVPDKLDRIVMKLLERDRDERYQEGYAAKQDLDQLLHEVAPGYTVNRLSRFVEENFSHLVQEEAEPQAQTVTSNPSDIAPSTPPPDSQQTDQRGTDQLRASGPETDSVEQPVPAGDGDPAATVTATPGELDEQTPPPSANDGGGAQRTRTSADETTGQFATGEPDDEETREAGGLPGAVYVILVLLIAIVGMLGYAFTVETSGGGGEGGAAPPGDGEPPSAGSEGPTGMISIEIDSKPEEARLLRKGRAVGRTPVSFSLPAGDDPIELTVAKDGYEPKSFRLKPEDEDLSTKVKLEAIEGESDAGVTADTSAPAAESGDESGEGGAHASSESVEDGSDDEPAPNPLEPPDDEQDRAPAEPDEPASSDEPPDDEADDEPEPTGEPETAEESEPTDDPAPRDESEPADESESTADSEPSEDPEPVGADDSAGDSERSGDAPDSDESESEPEQPAEESGESSSEDGSDGSSSEGGSEESGSGEDGEGDDEIIDPFE